VFIVPVDGVIRFVALRATTETTSAAILHQRVHVGRLGLNCGAGFDCNPDPFHDCDILVTALWTHLPVPQED
jgi:hypothetical protein